MGGSHPLQPIAVPPTDRGAALILAMLVTMVVTIIGGALVVAVATEHLITANNRDAEELLHAADAGLERALLELAHLSEWTAVIDGGAVSRSRDGTLSPRLPDGRVVNLVDLTQEIQASGGGPWGPDDPRWRLFVYGNLSQIIALTLDGPPLPYVVVWVADDQADGDGSPQRDTNDTLVLRSEAFGVRYGRRAVEATVTRPDPYPAPVRVLSWRLGE
ncbi:MAG: hypothetical protein GEU99_26240 [Luteitalea sp.]|nr:hypothetical protein [Luteitalea sp.]